MKSGLIGIAVAVVCSQGASATERRPAEAPSAYDAIIAKHSAATGVPEALIRRIIVRESRYNPNARNGGHYGMMQIKPATAQSMGYQGGPVGLLDADTNLTYGVRYLAGAYKVARGNPDRAVRLYASGYYYDAKRMGLLAEVGLGRGARFAAVPQAPVAASVAAAATTQPVKVETRMPATSPAAKPAPAVQTAALQPSAPQPAPSVRPQPSPRVISANVTPALASSLPATRIAAPVAAETPAMVGPAKPSNVATSRVASAASAVGGLQRVAAAEPATPDPQASAFANGRQASSSPFAGLAAPRAAAVPTPPLPPVAPTARAAAPFAAPVSAAVAAPAKVARPMPPSAPVQTAAAVPTPPARDPVQATAAIVPASAVRAPKPMAMSNPK